MATNYRTLARKLQTAISLQHGRRISIQTFQSYSPKAKRTVTKYVLSEYLEDSRKYSKLFESWSLPDVVKFMAGILNPAYAEGD